MATNYDINYNDSRFTDVTADEKAALNEVDVTYGNMISQSDKFYQDQIDAAQDYADKQTNLQNQQLQQDIKEINQQKEQTKQDYIKEQSGAYVDWQKQSNAYGANAEEMAAAGLAGSGYSESSQVAMYTTYQNRVATARESYNRAVLSYDNAIADAKLQNSSILAEIAYNALQKQLELSLQGFQYKNQLLLDKADRQMEVKKFYADQWQRVLTQINEENRLAEEVRQYDSTLAEQQRQHNEEMSYKNAALEEQKRQHDETLAEQRRQFNETMAAKNASSGGSGGGGGSIKKSGSGGSKKSNTAISKTKETNTPTKLLDNAGPAGGGGVSVDMNSVLALGYGPISASRLNELVKSGIIEEYESGGKLKYRKTAKTNKQFSLYQKLK